jgi:mono/diheme cytochrome c family protein
LAGNIVRDFHFAEIIADQRDRKNPGKTAHSSHPDRLAMSRSASYLLTVAPVLGAVLLVAGCLGETVISGQDPNADMAFDPNADLTGIAQSGPDLAVDPYTMFVNNVQGLLIADCGTCHAQAGGSYPGFLATTATSDVYTTFTHFPGLIGATPETSRILTKDVHVGPSFHASGTYTPSAQLQADAIVIADWIKVYNEHNTVTADTDDMGMKKARITPFLPVMGTPKSIDLGELDATYAGVTLTFTPIAIGTTSIQLKDITLKATASTGVKVTTPVFARYDAAKPTVAIDIDYDYLNKEITAYPGGSTVFGPSLTIFAYTSGQLIDVSFDKLAPATGSAPDMGGTSTCKNVAGFTTFKPMLTGTAGINCANCHNAGVGGFNTNGIANNANDATTCPAVLINTVPATPANSPIYLHVTDASNHAGGKLSAANATTFLAALTTWLNTEK